jgi:hypothetical protein
MKDTMIRLCAALLLAVLLPGCTPEATEEVPVEAPESTVAEAPIQEGLLDPNIADPDQLSGLGMSADAIAALVQDRPFDDMLQVDATLGELMEAEAREALYSQMFLRLDLNTASAEEIMLIPGVGNRMAREFDEYRPYTEIIEFRREIGKYVDDAEVARLEQYVLIP